MEGKCLKMFKKKFGKSQKCSMKVRPKIQKIMKQLKNGTVKLLVIQSEGYTLPFYDFTDTLIGG